MFVVVENLTLFNLIKSTLYIKFKHYAKSKILHSYYIEATPVVRLVIEFFSKIFHIEFIRLSWSYKELKDEEGYDWGMKIVTQEIPLILSKIITSEANSINKITNQTSYYDIYLKKILTASKWPGSQKSIRDFILMLCAIKNEAQKKDYNNNIKLFTDRIIWMQIISKYAKDRFNIELMPINTNFYYRIQEIFRYRFISSYMCMSFYSLIKYRNIKNITSDIESYKNPILLEIALQSFPLLEESNLNLGHVTFANKEHKLGAVQKKYIKDFKRPFIYMSPHLSNDEIIPVFKPDFKKIKVKVKYWLSSRESEFIKFYYLKYLYEIQLWECLFKKLDTKIYVTHYLWSPHCIAASVAIKNNGGISVMLQTSFYECAAANSITVCDIMFLFSNYNYLQNLLGSQIQYSIASGYLRDFTFATYKANAVNLRTELIENGAKKIICFFDQGSSDDSRWSMGHNISKCGYELLLKKVIEVKWLGLIIKPKKPTLLSNKLGDVSSLLNKALKTGRCFIFSSNDEILVKNFESPPALAAYASDLAIHDTLVSGTAGVEAALTGTPTVFFDNYGFSKSLFCQSNDGNIVFNDWNYLWSILWEHFTENPVPGLGDWSSIVEKIDPFNDGEAAERMGTYLSWLIQGFEQGFDRETILADAAERYCRQWGNDKITELN